MGIIIIGGLIDSVVGIVNGAVAGILGAAGALLPSSDIGARPERPPPGLCWLVGVMPFAGD
ncbi:hypothetical protein [Lentzea jiangxiensis]|uniref:Uncharacterized protein n=1 Tax=Lentzea jiangxiensis TaxID=641025 RepID=A0A1H0WS30_9PSEU|nr:hypothetical protein [Lentzea jiangxiensis]SDP93459.1 hypothetical protein SAMN05421507_12213 [Lentzea jiangxiensis]